MAKRPYVVEGLAVSRDLFYVVTTFEDEEAHISPSRLYQYDNGAWRYNEYGFLIQGLALHRAPGGERRALCITSKNGDVLFPHDESLHERIIDASSPAAKGKRLGRVFGMTQIEDHLYAWGEGGQTYRRSCSGNWSVMDQQLLNDQGDSDLPRKMLMRDGQPFGGRYGLLADDAELAQEYARRVLAADPNTFIWKLAGETEERIFAVGGKGLVLAWNGSAFLAVPTDRTNALTGVHAGGERVVVCGRDGAFLAGDEHDGFHQLPCASGSQLFLDVAPYRGQYYLASDTHPPGLFVSDLATLTQVTPKEMHFGSLHTVQAVDDVLWVFGSEQIVRYDGTSWTRFALPAVSP